MISENFLQFYKHLDNQAQFVLAADVLETIDPEMLMFLILFYIKHYKK
ncbi:MAG: hypothetical protein ACTSO7_18590 [Candidatus Heimdallarchaeota archaeon]